MNLPVLGGRSHATLQKGCGPLEMLGEGAGGQLGRSAIGGEGRRGGGEEGASGHDGIVIKNARPRCYRCYRPTAGNPRMFGFLSRFPAAP